MKADKITINLTMYHKILFVLWFSVKYYDGIFKTPSEDTSRIYPEIMYGTLDRVKT